MHHNGSVFMVNCKLLISYDSFDIMHYELFWGSDMSKTWEISNKFCLRMSNIALESKCVWQQKNRKLSVTLCMLYGEFLSHFYEDKIIFPAPQSSSFCPFKAYKSARLL